MVDDPPVEDPPPTEDPAPAPSSPAEILPSKVVQVSKNTEGAYQPQFDRRRRR